MNVDGIWLIVGGLYMAVMSRAAGRQLHAHIGRGKDESSAGLERTFLVVSLVLVVIGFIILFSG